MNFLISSFAVTFGLRTGVPVTQLIQCAGRDAFAGLTASRGTSIQPLDSWPGLIRCSTARPSRITNIFVKPATV